MRGLLARYGDVVLALALLAAAYALAPQACVP